MGFSIKKLINANVYLNGKEYAGIAAEVTLPEVKAKTKEFSPSALSGVLELPMGTEKMTMTIKGDFDEAFVAAAADIYHVQLLQIRCNLPNFDDSGRSMEQNVVAHVRAMPTGFKPGAVKGQEPGEVDYTFNIWAYKLEVDGVPIFDIDILANKHAVLGKNLHSTSNANLGR